MIHRPHLPYTEAVLHESMRLSSVIPTGALHKSSCDTSIGTGFVVFSNFQIVFDMLTRGKASYIVIAL